MKTRIICAINVRELIATLCIAWALPAPAAVHYVDLNCTTPTPPYTSWSSAATNIQDAIDAATDGDRVLVTNGVYQTGMVLVNSSTNRIAVTHQVTVESVNGPAVTVIDGGGQMRCAYLGNIWSPAGVLTGFALTNGYPQLDSYYGSSGAESGTLNNCILTGNHGFAVADAHLSHCALTGNEDGAGSCWLNDCTLTGNDSGAYACTLSNCTLVANRIGVYGGSSMQCLLASNSSWGAYSCTLEACALIGNSGYGAAGCTLSNCTITGTSGTGASSCQLYNSIVYYNVGLNYDTNCTLYACCTTPMPKYNQGTGNLTAEPQFADSWHLGATSPCRGAGSPDYAPALDCDGESWANPPSIGCDEFHAGASGPLAVTISGATYTNVAVGFSVDFTGNILGHAGASRWEFGDGTVISNRVYAASHIWSSPGQYTVALRAYNDSYPAGVSASITVQVVARPVYYVSVGSANPVLPYTTWATAATNIQDAVDAALVPGALVLVTNGWYDSGGGGPLVDYYTNRLAITKPLFIQSVNGPAVTVITGSAVARCAYLTNGAVLSGFLLSNYSTAPGAYGGTLTNCIVSDCYTVINGGAAAYADLINCSLSNNAAAGWGGAAYDCALTNCVLSANRSRGAGGGGAYGSTLDHCTLNANSTYADGAGALESTLVNCMLTGNNAGSYGGGAHLCTVNNCTFLTNSAYGGGGASESFLNQCLLQGNYAQTLGGGALGGLANSCFIWANRSDNAGGGAHNSMLNRCVVTGNSARSWGGGASSLGAVNCVLTGNSAGFDGGAAYWCSLTNSTLIGNSAIRNGGGTLGGNLYNSVVFYNTAQTNGPNVWLLSGRSYYCCTTPMPTNGVGNITNEPAFVDLAGGNLRLQSNSACINSGNNAYTLAGPDLDGNPRISGGTVDIGAYEFQNPVSTISYAWLQQHGLFPPNGATDTADPDGDGMNNWQEWRAGTDPHDAASALRMLSISRATNGVAVTWQSVPGISYVLERSTDPTQAPAFTDWYFSQYTPSNTTTFIDTQAVGSGAFFYRVRVQ